MSIKGKYILIVLSLLVLTTTFSLFSFFSLVEGAYGQGAYYSQGYYQGYYQSTYYSEATYYSQSSYQTTFSTNVSASGSFSITNEISKSSGSFVIDHPLDPKNKLLYHSFVESPDVKNLYDGVAQLDENGEARITLPEYFMVLNKDFRYQVRPIEQPMPDVYVKEGILNNSFTIAGGESSGRVSWQVTATRKDPFITDNPLIVEVKKSEDTIVGPGQFLYPKGFETRDTKLPEPSFWDAFINTAWKIFGKE